MLLIHSVASVSKPVDWPRLQLAKAVLPLRLAQSPVDSLPRVFSLQTNTPFPDPFSGLLQPTYQGHPHTAASCLGLHVGPAVRGALAARLSVWTVLAIRPLFFLVVQFTTFDASFQQLPRSPIVFFIVALTYGFLTCCQLRLGWRTFINCCKPDAFGFHSFSFPSGTFFLLMANGPKPPAHRGLLLGFKRQPCGEGS